MHAARSLAMLVVALGAVLGLVSTASAATCAGSGYLVTSTGTIQRFSTSTNAVTATLTGAGSQFSDVAISPDGRSAYAVDTAANLVRVVDTSTNTISASIGGLNTPVAIAVAPDGTRAYVVNSGSNTFSVVDTTTLTVTGSYPAGTSPTDAVVSADGSLLYVTAGTDLTARSTATGAVQTTFPLGATASAIARSATTAYTANDTPFSVSSALLTGSTASTLFSDMAGQPTAIAISPDGTRLYLGTAAVGRDSLMTASISGGALTSIGSGASFAVRDVAVSPDSSTVYATDYSQVTVTNAAGSPVTMVSGAVASGVTSIAVCPAAVPGAPTAAVADPGDTVAALSWTAPTDTGGAPITRYTATASPGGATCTTTGATTCLFTGLKNGTAYTFTVTATNVAGTSAASTASTKVTPRKDNRARVLAVGPATVTYTKKGVGVAFNVTTTSAGVIAAAMTYKGDRYCNVSKRVTAAGTYRVKCVMKAAGRALARKRSTTYTLNASFSPTNGPLASATPSVVVPRRR
ncbi:MAG: fibronectin type III domain-containing protein [Thermoleophilia bacterium]